MDRALELVVRRLDIMERLLVLTLNSTSRAVHLLDVRLESDDCLNPKPPDKLKTPKQITRVVRHRPYYNVPFVADERLGTKRSTNNINYRGPFKVATQRSLFRRNLNRFGEDIFKNLNEEDKDVKMKNQLSEVAKKVDIIDTKISTLQEQLDFNTILKPTDELVASASESFRFGIGAADRFQSVGKISDLEHLENTVHDVRNSLETIERRIQTDSLMSTQNFYNVSKQIMTLQSVITDLKEKNDYECIDRATKNELACTRGIDEVNAKVDSVANTVNKIEQREDLSGALKEESEKHSCLLEQIKSQITVKSSQILKGISEMKKEFRKIRSNAEKRSKSANPRALPQKDFLFSAQDSILSFADSNVVEQHELESSISDSVNRTITNNDRNKHPGVIFPRKHNKPVESAFLSASNETEIQGYSCLDLLQKGQRQSGIYHLKIRGTTYWFLQVYCDMETAGGGWTVIQRRDDFGEPRESFNREWAAYKHGFGRPDRELWLGNENIYMLTNTEQHKLRVELEDFTGAKRYAEYKTFKLHDEHDSYRLEIGGYNGTAGDALSDPWYGSNLSPFSTTDQDNDRSSLNCASMLKGGWWWRSCGRGLNGLYLTNPNDFTARQGIVWFRWKGWDYTLKKTVLMIKPKTKEDKKS